MQMSRASVQGRDMTQDLQETQDTWEICTLLEPHVEARQTLQSILNATKDTCGQQNNTLDLL